MGVKEREREAEPENHTHIQRDPERETKGDVGGEDAASSAQCLFLHGHLSYWSRAPPLWLHLTLLFPYSKYNHMGNLKFYIYISDKHMHSVHSSHLADFRGEKKMDLRDTK